MEKIDPTTPSIEEWKKLIQDTTISEILAYWNELPEELSLDYFLLLTTAQQSDILIQLSTSQQETLISKLTQKNIEELIQEVPPDDLVDLYQKVTPEVREAVWHHLSDEKKHVANFLLRFDYDDAAGIMTPNYVKVLPNITVAQTISFIRKNIQDVETIYYIYIVDMLGRLQGVVSLRDLFMNNDNVLLSTIMVTNVYSVEEHADREITAKLLQEHDLLAIPVVDKFNRLLGIVTVDDAMTVISDEHNEDVLQMGAISAYKTPSTDSYLENKISHLFLSRIPWLAILLLAGTLTSNVINIFTELLHTWPYLILFIPVITSTGGNTATQSATLMIRGLAREEIEFKNVLSVIFKESVVAFLLGLSLALVMFIRSLYFPPSISFLQASIISLSLVFVVLFSALVGVLAPLCISRIKVDPTVIATPLIATFIDLIGLAIYFSIAQFILTI